MENIEKMRMLDMLHSLTIVSNTLVPQKRLKYCTQRQQYLELLHLHAVFQMLLILFDRDIVH